MWVTGPRNYNTVDVDDPAAYLDSALQAQIDALSEKEKVYLDLGMSELLETVHAQLDRLLEDDEAAFVMREPPLDFQLKSVRDEENLLEGLAVQLDAVPLRWRLDMVEVVAAYIAEYGPSFRRWKKFAKQIEKEARKTVEHGRAVAS